MHKHLLPYCVRPYCLRPYRLRSYWLGPRWRSVAILLIVVAATVTTPRNLAHANDKSALYNGNFEAGFVAQPVCASSSQEAQVGEGWGCFSNRGAASFGFYADSWAPVVADGHYSQLIEINTWGVPNADNDRYAGIYHVVPIQPGAQYRLSLRGMIRTTKLDGDEWRYTVQVGYLQGVNPNWSDVTNWSDVGWYTYYKRTEPGKFSQFQSVIGPTHDRVTIFIRLWKKWGITDEEVNLNLDMISLEKVDAPKPPKK